VEALLFLLLLSPLDSFSLFHSVTSDERLGRLAASEELPTHKEAKALPVRVQANGLAVAGSWAIA